MFDECFASKLIFTLWSFTFNRMFCKEQVFFSWKIFFFLPEDFLNIFWSRMGSSIKKSWIRKFRTKEIRIKILLNNKIILKIQWWAYFAIFKCKTIFFQKIITNKKNPLGCELSKRQSSSTISIPFPYQFLKVCWE